MIRIEFKSNFNQSRLNFYLPTSQSMILTNKILIGTNDVKIKSTMCKIDAHELSFNFPSVSYYNGRKIKAHPSLFIPLESILFFPFKIIQINALTGI